MHKIVSVNLNGRAYQLEEDGYQRLNTYLEQARTNLSGDPDKDEIMRDFEQAIADKCSERLTEHKDVITTAEIKDIIDIMGPVESAAEPKQSDTRGGVTTESTSEQPPKRLYTLKEGSMIGGVCIGLATYLKVDVSWVRIAFVVLAFITSGVWIIIYLLMMMIIPEAKTSEQKAELRGEGFTAQDIIDRAKQKYSEMSQDEKWKKMAHDTVPVMSGVATVMGRFFSGVTAVTAGIIFGITTAAYAIAMRLTIFDNIHLIDQLQTISMWAIVAGLTALYVLIAIPFLVMSLTFQRYASHRAATRSATVLSSVAWVGWTIALVVFVSVAFTVGPRVNNYLQSHDAIYFDNATLCIDEPCIVKE